jgi:uncharacterized protein (TIGR04255 family)
MSLSELIVPCNKDHSIKEAVITLFLANPIIKPERFKKLIENEFKDKFQQFQTVSNIEIQFQNKPDSIGNLAQQVLSDIGFKFLGFANGGPSKVLQAINEKQRNFISFHYLQYSRWANFYDDFIETIKIISNQHPDLFVTAVSLHYLDEFFWRGPLPIDLKQVFNEAGDYLPKEFFKSQISNYTIVTNKEIDDVKYFNRLEININDSIRPGISISHNISQTYNDVVDLGELLKKPEFGSTLEKEHIHNKTILKDILQPLIVQAINLT